MVLIKPITRPRLRPDAAEVRLDMDAASSAGRGRRWTSCSGNCCRLRSIGKFDIGLFHAGNVDVFGDELRKGPCLADRRQIDGWNTLAWINAAAGRTAAIDDHNAHFTFNRRRLEAVNGLAAREFCNTARDRMNAATGDGDDLVTLGRQLNNKRAAPTILAPGNFYCFIGL